MGHESHTKSEDVFGLIQSCLHNEELEDASLYAHTPYEMVLNDADSIIPSEQREELLAAGCYWLARATFHLAQAGGIPPEEMQKAGEKAIALSRQALEIHTQQYGIENMCIAADMTILGNVLNYLNNVDDDEILRLHEQANAITSRLEGSASLNVGIGEQNLGAMYIKRAFRAQAAKDWDRCMANFQWALTHYREAARIFRENNHVDKADAALHDVVEAEKDIRRIATIREAAAVIS